jgi:hypothetical protein
LLVIRGKPMRATMSENAAPCPLDHANRPQVDWFNHRRLLESFGNILPDEAEERYYAVPETSDMTA